MMTTQIAKPPATGTAPAADNDAVAVADVRIDAAAGGASGVVDWANGDGLGWPVRLDLRPLLGGKTLADVDADCIASFLAANELYAIEYNDTGELVIMPPMLMPGGNLESRLIAFVTVWALAHGGVTPSSTTVFRIPGLGGRGPDASWVSAERLATLDPEQYRTGQICPDFVAEIRSVNDSLAYLQRKMAEYIDAGARLGWLIDPRNRRVTVYRPGREPEVLEDPEILHGEDVMPGFEFRVRDLIFDAGR